MIASICGSSMNAPWMRCSREEPTGEKSMSPMPSSDSAPFWSRITRESVCEDTANAIRDGTLALIMPVITSTRGDCVASTRWMPTARAFWAIRMIESSTSAGRDHHQVRELVDHAQDVRQRRLVAASRGPC